MKLRVEFELTPQAIADMQREAVSEEEVIDALREGFEESCEDIFDPDTITVEVIRD